MSETKKDHRTTIHLMGFAIFAVLGIVTWFTKNAIWAGVGAGIVFLAFLSNLVTGRKAGLPTRPYTGPTTD